MINLEIQLDNLKKDLKKSKYMNLVEIFRLIGLDKGDFIY